METKTNNVVKTDLSIVSYYLKEYQAYDEYRLSETRIMSTIDDIATYMIEQHAESNGLSPHDVREEGLQYIYDALNKEYKRYKLARIKDLLTAVINDDLIHGVQIEDFGGCHGVKITYTNEAAAKLRDLYGDDSDEYSLYDITIRGLMAGAEKVPDDISGVVDEAWSVISDNFDEDVASHKEPLTTDKSIQVDDRGNIIINEIKFYISKYSGGLVAYDKVDVVDIYDAKRLIEKLLYTYIKANPYKERWSITIETTDGTAVECSWSCASYEHNDEYITTAVDGERLQDRNQASDLLQAYEIGEAKCTLANTSNKELREIDKEWFNDHVVSVMDRYPDEFSDEERKRLNQVRPLLSDY
jgi:hypothetical protein|nr:MAG TPA: hypothetical protein [Caudoviricetes sp.]